MRTIKLIPNYSNCEWIAEKNKVLVDTIIDVIESDTIHIKLSQRVGTIFQLLPDYRHLDFLQSKDGNKCGFYKNRIFEIIKDCDEDYVISHDMKIVIDLTSINVPCSNKNKISVEQQ